MTDKDMYVETYEEDNLKTCLILKHNCTITTYDDFKSFEIKLKENKIDDLRDLKDCIEEMIRQRRKAWFIKMREETKHE